MTHSAKLTDRFGNTVHVDGEANHNFYNWLRERGTSHDIAVKGVVLLKQMGGAEMVNHDEIMSLAEFVGYPLRKKLSPQHEGRFPSQEVLAVLSDATGLTIIDLMYPEAPASMLSRLSLLDIVIWWMVSFVVLLLANWVDGEIATAVLLMNLIVGLPASTILLVVALRSSNRVTEWLKR